VSGVGVGCAAAPLASSRLGSLRNIRGLRGAGVQRGLDVAGATPIAELSGPPWEYVEVLWRGGL